MKFDTKHYGNYKEFILYVDRTEITSGLLDKQEVKALGKDLFEAVYALTEEEDFKELIKEVYTKEELFGEDDE